MPWSKAKTALSFVSIWAMPTSAEQYLKPGIALKQLHDMAIAISDNDAAKQLNEAKLKLYKIIFEQKHRAA
jgi:hypothetical protein